MRGLNRLKFNPYQKKVFFQAKKESSSSFSSDEQLNEDITFQREQPFMTPTLINYKELLKQVKI